MTCRYYEGLGPTFREGGGGTETLEWNPGARGKRGNSGTFLFVFIYKKISETSGGRSENRVVEGDSKIRIKQGPLPLVLIRFLRGRPQSSFVVRCLTLLVAGRGS